MKQFHITLGEEGVEISCGHSTPGLLLVFRKPGRQVCVWGDIKYLEKIKQAIEVRLQAPPPWGLNKKEAPNEKCRCNNRSSDAFDLGPDSDWLRL